MKIPYTMDHEAPSCIKETDVLNLECCRSSPIWTKQTLIIPLTPMIPQSLSLLINFVQTS